MAGIIDSIFGSMNERSRRKQEYKYIEQMEQGISIVEQQLTSQGFTVSRKVGHIDKERVLWSTYILYVDDVKKKWVVASPLEKKADKIRNYSDLEGVSFFDEESDSTFDKLSKATQKANKNMATAFGAVAGVAVGGVVGGVVGGIGGSKFGDSFNSRPDGMSCAYSIAIKTKDCDVNNPALIYDFLRIDGKGSKITKNSPPRLNRSDNLYKADIETIKEMGEVFDYIIRAN